MNYIYGTAGGDNLISQTTPGPDVVIGNGGADVLWGGGGKDVFVVDADDVKEFIYDFEDGRDLVDLREVGVQNFSQLIILFEYNTDIAETTVGPMRLYMNEFVNEGRVDIDPTDFIFTSTPVFEYSLGNDFVVVRDNVYSVHFGNGGRDTLSLVNLEPGAGNEGASLFMDVGLYGTGKIELAGVTQHFFEFQHARGTSGRDHIVGDGRANILMGQGGNDVLVGRNGNDHLVGHTGFDRLFGNVGNDKLSGGMGRDSLSGGPGADTFIFKANDNYADIVRDFQDGVDRFDVSDWGVSSVSELSITSNGDGSVTVAYEAEDVSFIVQGWGDTDVTPQQLGNDDFIFG